MIPRNLQRSDRRSTDPEKTWVSNSSIATYLARGPIGFRSHSTSWWNNKLSRIYVPFIIGLFYMIIGGFFSAIKKIPLRIGPIHGYAYVRTTPVLVPWWLHQELRAASLFQRVSPSVGEPLSRENRPWKRRVQFKVFYRCTYICIYI